MDQARGRKKDDDPLVAVGGGGHVESVEETARTVHEAVRRALQKLGKAEDEVDVTVVSRGSPPQILAFGAEPAQVRVAVKPETPELEPVLETEPPSLPPADDAEDAAADADLQGTRDAEFAQTMLAELLDRMGLTLDIQVRSIDPVTLNAVGPGVAELIGRRGTTLHALQFVLSMMVNKQLERRIRLVVDADGYRQRRENLLESMAERLAQRVRVTGQQMVLEPMPPNERRIVHLALVDDPEVTTESEGAGDDRRVAIKPR
jgi:spoIIIJ-associated protein